MASSSHGDVALEICGIAFIGNLRRLKKLISEVDHGDGPAITVANIKERGRTALHAAAGGGQFYVCKYLIEELKLDVNEQDEWGQTPLFLATYNQNLRTTTYLLEKGANPTLGNDHGSTALHHAATKGYKKLIRLLISKGAVVDAEGNFGAPLFSTPLLCALAHRQKEAVKILLDNNANPNKVAHHCYSPLIVSILVRSFECVKLLLEYRLVGNLVGLRKVLYTKVVGRRRQENEAGADLNTDLCGMTPLQVAAFEGETEITKCLLKAGANPNFVNNDGFTPVEIAAWHGNHEDVMILFPVTSQIPSIPDWSFEGIVKYAHSDEAREQRKLEQKEYFSYSKSKGEEAFKRMDYISAIFWYSEAIHTDPNDAVVLLNRSLCWTKLNKENRTISDTHASLALSPDKDLEVEAAFREEAAQAGFSVMCLAKVDEP